MYVKTISCILYPRSTNLYTCVAGNWTPAKEGQGADRLHAAGLQLRLHAIGNVLEEIAVQDVGDAYQQGHINVVTRKDIIDVRAVAREFARKPGDGTLLPLQLLLDKFADWFHRIRCVK